MRRPPAPLPAPPAEPPSWLQQLPWLAPYAAGRDQGAVASAAATSSTPPNGSSPIPVPASPAIPAAPLIDRPLMAGHQWAPAAAPSAPAPAAVTQPPTPAPAAETGGWGEDIADLYSPTGDGTVDDANDDPVDEYGDEEDAAELPEAAPTRRRGRRGTARPQRHTSALKGRPAAVSTAPPWWHKVLGISRPAGPKAKGRTARSEPEWLSDLDSEQNDTAPAVAEPGTAATATPNTTAAAAALGKRAPTPDDWAVGKAPRGVTQAALRWLGAAVLVLILAAGINQVIVKPIRGGSGSDSSSTSTAAQLDPAGAQQAAIRYAVDYFSYQPQTTQQGIDALAADINTTASDNGAVGQRWTGTGFLSAESAVPGQVTRIDGTHLVINVAVHVHAAMPPAAAAATTTESSAASAAATGPVKQSAGRVPPSEATTAAGSNPTGSAAVSSADIAVGAGIPAGWKDLGTHWLTLAVPVEWTSTGPKVTGSGAVLNGEVPGLITAPVNGSVDSSIGDATTPVARQLFTAYATSDLTYLSAPGQSLTGLNDTVSFTNLANWSVTVPPSTTSAPATSGVGTGTVSWQLPGTDLQISEVYAVALSNTQGRWYTAALSPSVPAHQ